MLEVRRVVDAGREHDGHRALARARGGMEQRLEQETGVVVDGAHGVGGEELREHAVEQGTVLEHVRHAAGHAAVVLENQVASLAVADDVGAHHVGEDLPRRDHPTQLPLVLAPRVHQLRGDDVVAEAFLLLVDVQQEEVEGGDALDEPVLEELPLRGGNDAGDEIEGEDALEAILLPVDGERDALVHEGEALQALAARHVVQGERLEDGDERGVVRPGRARAPEHLVEARLRGHPLHRES